MVIVIRRLASEIVCERVCMCDIKNKVTLSLLHTAVTAYQQSVISSFATSNFLSVGLRDRRMTLPRMQLSTEVSHERILLTEEAPRDRCNFANRYLIHARVPIC